MENLENLAQFIPKFKAVEKITLCTTVYNDDGKKMVSGTKQLKYSQAYTKDRAGLVSLR